MGGLRLWLVFVLFGSVACARPDRRPLARRPPAPAGPQVAVAERLRRALVEFDARLARELPANEGRSWQHCPDDALEAQDGERATLLVRLRDARSDRRQLLPLGLQRALGAAEASELSEEANRIAESVRRAAEAPPLGKAAVLMPDSAQSILERVERLNQRRYLAELVIEGFSAPHNFRRLGQLHSEWDAGRLSARLVIYDLERRAPVCQGKIDVKGDASGASLARRLREQTRSQLEGRLYGRALQTAQNSLFGMTRVLRWPATAASDKPDSLEPPAVLAAELER